MNAVYRPDIDGLRAIAVSLVVFNHAFPRLLPGGYVGVDIFFVISGFLITSLIMEEQRSGSFSIARFYARRVRRIFPALVLVLATVLVMGWLFLMPNEFSALGRSIAASALFSANLQLLTDVDYFDALARLNPLLHIWSLGVEEQFYIAWPLLLALWASFRVSARWLVAGTIAASLFACVIVTSNSPTVAFYLPFTRAWELATGGLLYVFRGYIPTVLNPRALFNVGAAGLAAIVIPAFVFTERTPFPGFAAIVPVVGAALLIATAASPISQYWLSARPAVFVGLISYPLYLWHWPFLVFADLMKGRALGYGRHLTDLENAICVLAAGTLAWLTYRFIETPIRHNRSRLIVPALVGTATATAAFGFLCVLEAGFPNRLPEAVREIAAIVPGRDGIRSRVCLFPATPTISFMPECTDRSKHPAVAIWGDSTAAALRSGFDRVALSDRPAVSQYTVESCPPLLVNSVSLPDHCVQANSQVLAIIKEAQPDMVILHAIWGPHAKQDLIAPTVAALRDIGIRRILLVGPVPVWSAPLPKLITDYYLSHRQLVPTHLATSLRASPADRILQEISDSLKVEYFSAMKALCNEHGCLTRTGPEPRQVAMSDHVHLTLEGASVLVKRLLAESSIMRDKEYLGRAANTE